MKYLLGVLGLIVLAIMAIVLIARTGENTSIQEGERAVVLTDYNTPNSRTVYTTDGEINGEDLHRGIRISVSASERKVEILTGYNGTVQAAESFPNTSAAYENFIYALNRAGFTRVRETDIPDERGVCPEGRRFIYELYDNGEQVLRLWSTSCSSRGDGSFGGDNSTVRQLFEDQITNFDDFTSDVDL